MSGLANGEDGGRDVEAWRFEVLDRFSAAINRHIEVGASFGRPDLALRQLERMVGDMENETGRMEARVSRALDANTHGRQGPAGTGD